MNKPVECSIDRSDELSFVTGRGGDFWRETHYGFVHDTGHFLGFETTDAFTAQVRVRARYEALYDQAGIMVRLDERRWVKAGIELSDGRAQLSSVLTNDRSDWAVGLFDGDPEDFGIRATVSSGTLRIQASPDGRRWGLSRLAPFPVAPAYRVGPMACTPRRGGLHVLFSDLQILPPSGKELHDPT